MGHFRDIMILKAAGKPTDDMAFSGDELEKIKGQAAGLSLEEILYILQNLSHALSLMKASTFTRAPLEITLVRLALRKQAVSLPEILARMEKGEHESYGPAEAPGHSARHDAASGASHHRKERPLSRPRALSAGTEISGEGDDGDESSGVITGGKVHWNAVLNYVKNKKMSVFTFLNAGKPVEFNSEKVVIGFGKEHTLNRDFLDNGDNRAVVEEAVGKVTGASPKVEFAIRDFLGGPSKDAPPADASKRAREREEINPLIERAMDVFGGQIVRDLNEDLR